MPLAPDGKRARSGILERIPPTPINGKAPSTRT